MILFTKYKPVKTILNARMMFRYYKILDLTILFSYHRYVKYHLIHDYQHWSDQQHLRQISITLIQRPRELRLISLFSFPKEWFLNVLYGNFFIKAVQLVFYFQCLQIWCIRLYFAINMTLKTTQFLEIGRQFGISVFHSFTIFYNQLIII